MYNNNNNNNNNNLNNNNNNLNNNNLNNNNLNNNNLNNTFNNNLNNTSNNISKKNTKNKFNSLYIDYNDILPDKILTNLSSFLDYNIHEQYKINFNLFLLKNVIKINEDNELLKKFNCLKDSDEFIDFYFDKIDDKLNNNNLDNNSRNYLVQNLKKTFISNKKHLEQLDNSINKIVKLKKMVNLSNVVNNKLNFQFLNNVIFLEDHLKDDIGECMAHFLFLYIQITMNGGTNLTNNRLSKTIYQNNLFTNDSEITNFADLHNIIKFMHLYYLIINNFASSNKKMGLIFQYDKFIEFVKKNIEFKISKNHQQKDKKKHKQKKHKHKGGTSNITELLRERIKDKMKKKNKKSTNNNRTNQNKEKNKPTSNEIIKKFEKINIIINEKESEYNSDTYKQIKISLNNFYQNKYNNRETFETSIRKIIKNKLEQLNSISLNSSIVNPFNDNDTFDIQKILKKFSDQEKKQFYELTNKNDRIDRIINKINFNVFNYQQIGQLLLIRENESKTIKFMNQLQRNLLDLYLCIFIKKRELINLFLNSILFRFNNMNNISSNNLMNNKLSDNINKKNNNKSNNENNNKNNRQQNNNKKLKINKSKRKNIENAVESKIKEYKIIDSKKKKKVEFLLTKLFELEEDKGTNNYDKKIYIIQKKIRTVLLNVN